MIYWDDDKKWTVHTWNKREVKTSQM
jgi:hypothetical protein